MAMCGLMAVPHCLPPNRYPWSPRICDQNLQNHAIKLQGLDEQRRAGVDRIDRKLLNLLQEDASRTNARLAEEVGLSPSSCLRRIRRLTSVGVIDRIVAILNPARADRRIKAIVTVELVRHGEQHTRRFLALATEEKAVTQAYSVSGQTDVVLMLRLADMAEFDALCERLFQDGSNVARYYTMFVIRTAKETTAIPL